MRSWETYQAGIRGEALVDAVLQDSPKARLPRITPGKKPRISREAWLVRQFQEINQIHRDLAKVTGQEVPPISGFYAFQRSFNASLSRPRIEFLHQHGFDVVDIAKKGPSSLTASKEKISDLLNAFELRGFDPRKILRDFPRLFTCSVKKVEDVFDFFRLRSVDAMRVVDKYPNVFSHSLDKLRKTFELLEQHDLNPLKVIDGCSSIFSRSMDYLRGVFNLMETQGIDVQNLDKSPSVFRTSLKKLRSNLSYLRERGFDYIRAVNLNPSVLTYSEGRTPNLVRYLELEGIDVVKLVDLYPSFLSISVGKFRQLIGLLRKGLIDYTPSSLIDYPEFIICPVGVIKKLLDPERKMTVDELKMRISDNYRRRFASFDIANNAETLTAGNLDLTPDKVLHSEEADELFRYMRQLLGSDNLDCDQTLEAMGIEVTENNRTRLMEFTRTTTEKELAEILIS